MADGRLPVPVARAIVGCMLQVSYRAVAEEAPLVERQLRARPRAAAAAASRSSGKALARVPLVRAGTSSSSCACRGLPGEQAAALVTGADLDWTLEAYWKESQGGLILSPAHRESRGRRRPGSRPRLADQRRGRRLSFPELFELFTRPREQWGVNLIPWRNLREMFGVLRRREILALLIDWGYRADGIPVRMFGAWTTLPAGPAALAAKTGRRSCTSQSGDRRTADVLTCRTASRSSRHGVRACSAPARDAGDGRCSRRRRSPPRPSSGTASSRSGPRPRRNAGSERARRRSLPGRPGGAGRGRLCRDLRGPGAASRGRRDGACALGVAGSGRFS